MRAIIFAKPGQWGLQTVPDPSPGPAQVVVAVGACGVCGTDLHIADGEFPPTPYPITPGHEFAGQVVAVGAGVASGITVGDRVAVDPSVYCGYCRPCRAGRGNLCDNWGAIGDTLDGAFAEYVVVPAANAYRLPPEVSDLQGALIEPLSCAVHAMRRLGSVQGSSVVVAGAGTMGLLLEQLLLSAGAATVAVVDRVAPRLEVARLLGAVTAGSLDELAGERFDVAVDATGAPAVITGLLDLLARGGRLLVFGVSGADARVPVSPFRIYNDELTIVGSMAVLNSFGAAADLMTAGSIRSSELLGDAYPLADFGKALEDVRAGHGVKVQVAPGE